MKTIIVIILIFFLSFYFLPTIVASVNRKKNLAAIFALNLFLGWSFIGWVIALVWALAHDLDNVKK
jgi:Superinfection immunity protein